MTQGDLKSYDGDDTEKAYEQDMLSRRRPAQ